MILEFNDAQSSAIKSIAVKNETNIKCTTRFMSGKLLMFAKLSLKSFIYSLVELLYFPDENPTVQSIYNKYNIEKIHCYHILTDTDSKAIQFVIISNIESTYPEKKVHENLYEIFSCTEIVNRFDTSDEYWKGFNVCWPNNKKKTLGLYEVEHINDSCFVTLAVNPKEYFELFKSMEINKKHKGIKKGSSGMNYENYAERIKPLYDFDTYKKPKADSKNLVRISVKRGEMTTYTIKKKISQLNDKRFYFPSGIISLPFGHKYLEEIDNYKNEKGQRIEKYFWKENTRLLELEDNCLKKKYIFLE